MLAVEDLDVFYGDAQALDGIALSVAAGALVAIVGANGAGKTTLIRAIAGMLRPARGRITFRGADITGWPSHRICNLGIGQVADAEVAHVVLRRVIPAPPASFCGPGLRWIRFTAEECLRSQ
jgi:ABC-type branched-subunit amino acid transport system ATPase component